MTDAAGPLAPDARVVVVGAGQAGASFVARLRAEGFAGPLTLIGEEPAPPYQRPPLSKAYLKGEMPRERLFLRPESWYADKNVDLRTGLRAEAIDLPGRVLALSDGSTLGWDRLVLATGSTPRRLPSEMGGDLPGVHLVRGLADVDALAADVAPGRRALVVGGGWIGLEAAAVLVGLGLRTTLLEAAPRILGRVACAETADWFAALHRARGVDLREGAALSRLVPGPDGRVARAELADGTSLEVDLVVTGIGVTPNVALAEAAGLAVDDGVTVDALGRASDPAVLAVGDAASFPLPGGGRLRLESVQNAIDHAEATAAALAGGGEPYAPVPWFWSDQYDVKLQIAGLARDWDRVVARPGAREGALSHWYFRDGRLQAVDAISDPRAYMTGKRWLEAGASPDPDAIGDPGRDLKTL